MTVTFDVLGPFEVMVNTNHKGGKRIADSEKQEFWDVNSEVATSRGCYILAIRNRGLIPVYVGKATRSFKQEVFTPDKLNKFNLALHTWTHGTPVLMFVATTSRGSSVASAIGKMEQYLIREAKLANPDLINKHFTGPELWEIRGVTVPQKGPLGDSRRKFKLMLNM